MHDVKILLVRSLVNVMMDLLVMVLVATMSMSASLVLIIVASTWNALIMLVAMGVLASKATLSMGNIVLISTTVTLCRTDVMLTLDVLIPMDLMNVFANLAGLEMDLNVLI